MRKIQGRQNISKDKLLFVLIVFILIIGFGGYTYARYFTSLSGNATTSVAAWNAVIKKNSVPTTTNLDLVLTPTTNTDVVSGKIAPGLSATGTYEIDFAGSEVSADYIVNFGIATNLPAGATLSITATETINGVAGTPETVTVGNEYEGNFTLSEITTGTGAKVLFTITANWPNNESNNITDTTAGTAHNNITIPITITARQSIPIIYVVSTVEVNNGQVLPQGAIGRNTPTEAMNDWINVAGTTKPYYLKYFINESKQITESYVEFVITPEMAGANPGMKSGTYTLKGGDSGAAFNDNITVMKEAFDYINHSSRCGGDQTSYFGCNINGLYVDIQSYGNITVYDEEYYYCSLYGTGSSYCEGM